MPGTQSGVHSVWLLGKPILTIRDFAAVVARSGGIRDMSFDRDWIPETEFTGVWRDSAGLTWVSVRHSEEDWKKNAPASAGSAHVLRLGVDDAERLYRTSFEVLDLEGGRVVTRGSTPEDLRPAGDGYMFRVVADSSNGYVVEIWRAIIER